MIHAFWGGGPRGRWGGWGGWGGWGPYGGWGPGPGFWWRRRMWGRPFWGPGCCGCIIPLFLGTSALVMLGIARFWGRWRRATRE